MCSTKGDTKLGFVYCFDYRPKSENANAFVHATKFKYFPGMVLHKSTITIWSTILGKYPDFDCRPKSENAIAFVLQAKQ